MKAIYIQTSNDDDMIPSNDTELRIPVYAPKGVQMNRNLTFNIVRYTSSTGYTKVTAMRGKAKIFVGGVDMGHSYEFPVISNNAFTIQTTEDDVIRIENFKVSSMNNFISRSYTDVPMPVINFDLLPRQDVTIPFNISSTSTIAKSSIFGNIESISSKLGLSILLIEIPTELRGDISELHSVNGGIKIISENIHGNFYSILGRCTTVSFPTSKKIEYKIAQRGSNLNSVKVVDVPMSDLGSGLGLLFSELAIGGSTAITLIDVAGDESSLNHADVTTIKTQSPAAVIRVNGSTI